MKVYFAHPCFNEEQQQFKGEFLRRLLEATGNGIIIVDPFEYAANVEHSVEEKLRMSGRIKDACLELLRECQVLIALVDWNDTGTAFEAGYAHCLDLPIILISRTECASANAMLIGAASARYDNVQGEEQIGALAAALTEMARTSSRLTTQDDDEGKPPQ
jgi:nucleoside 2-deoxyribosyltransferase